MTAPQKRGRLLPWIVGGVALAFAWGLAIGYYWGERSKTSAPPAAPAGAPARGGIGPSPSPDQPPSSQTLAPSGPAVAPAEPKGADPGRQPPAAGSPPPVDGQAAGTAQRPPLPEDQQTAGAAEEAPGSEDEQPPGSTRVPASPEDEQATDISQEAAPPVDAGPTWPWTAFRAVTRADLRGMSVPELELMRSEIHARHGWVFEREDLRIHFEGQPWYQPRGDLTDMEAANRYAEEEMSPLERQNIRTIIQYERAQQRRP